MAFFGRLVTPGDFIRIRRECKNLTQEELAHKVGVSELLISRLEKGETSVRSLKIWTLVKISNEVSIDEVELAEMMNAPKEKNKSQYHYYG